MKKIINGAKYDTATAKELGNWDNNELYGDFKYCEETLYRTKSGKYFLHGEGGAMSIYSESCGNNSRSGGEEIIPMSREAAMEWAGERLDGEEYEAIFGEVEEAADDAKEQMNVFVSPKLKQALWKIAEERKLSLSAVVDELLSRTLE
jgi:hypothetical protein